MLGAEYEGIVNEAVIAQITQKEQETGVEFWNAEEGGLTELQRKLIFILMKREPP